MMIMHWLKAIGGIVLVAFGLLFSLQGLDVIKGSAMSGQTVFVAVGIIVALLGVWLLWSLRAGTARAHVG
jgi:hypothetical protein